MQQIRTQLVAYPRGIKRLIVVGIDLSLVSACLWTAFLLKFDSFVLGLNGREWLYLCAVGSALAAFAVLGLYRAVVRFISFRALVVIFLGGGVSAACLPAATERGDVLRIGRWRWASRTSIS